MNFTSLPSGPTSPEWQATWRLLVGAAGACGLLPPHDDATGATSVRIGAGLRSRLDMRQPCTYVAARTGRGTPLVCHCSEVSSGGVTSRLNNRKYILQTPQPNARSSDKTVCRSGGTTHPDLQTNSCLGLAQTWGTPCSALSGFFLSCRFGHTGFGQIVRVPIVTDLGCPRVLLARERCLVG